MEAYAALKFLIGCKKSCDVFHGTPYQIAIKQTAYVICAAIVRGHVRMDVLLNAEMAIKQRVLVSKEIVNGSTTTV